MAFTTATKETAALAVTGIGNTISLHTGDPGTTGTAETTGGSPAYARKTTTWTGGTVDGTVTGSAVAFDVPAGTYTHIGVWNGATFVGGFALASSTGALPGQTVVTVTPSITAS
ncbi:hypothetical protein GCM10009651_35690 [Microbacterium natoriense]